MPGVDEGEAAETPPALLVADVLGAIDAADDLFHRTLRVWRRSTNLVDPDDAGYVVALAEEQATRLEVRVERAVVATDVRADLRERAWGKAHLVDRFHVPDHKLLPGDPAADERRADGLVLGYAALPERDFERGIVALCDLLHDELSSAEARDGGAFVQQSGRKPGNRRQVGPPRRRRKRAKTGAAGSPQQRSKT
jgi:hypothetical protein